MVKLTQTTVSQLKVGGIVECNDWAQYKITYLAIKGKSFDLTGIHTTNKNLVLSGSFDYVGNPLEGTKKKIIGVVS